MTNATPAEAFRLLHIDPARSEALCRQALAEGGEEAGLSLLLAAALRLQGDYAAACALAQPLAQAHPQWGGAQFELAMALGGLGRHAEALGLLRKAEHLGPLPGLWREIGDRLWAQGETAAAEQAYLRHLGAAPLEPLTQEALAALQRGDAASGERLLRLQLARHPGDVLAMRHLAEALSGAGRYDEAEPALWACLERAPSFALARYGLAMVLMHADELSAALKQAERLLDSEPNRLEFLGLKADILVRFGDFAAAKACLEHMLALFPNDAGAWTNLGHTLRTLGERAQCEAAYKRAIALNPKAGDAYWGLANLKTFRFADDEITQMREGLQRLRQDEDAAPLLFALGRALEDKGDYDQSFAAYAKANALRKARAPHDQAAWEESARRARAVFTPEFFAARKGVGCADEAPIFIVGMPRSGSTLVEQILASHSAVEGTMELLELLVIAKRLGKEGDYPELLRDMSAEAYAGLGEEYLRRTRPFRRTGARRFIDKMPNNFPHVGLIHLILPNARIIDVRRHPLACCLSNFKQHWASGQNFAYDLEELGAFYRNYVASMAHFDAVLPGRVHRVIYEDLVADPERETRRLLQACGLPFEPQCLSFYETKRAVRTPSSEQVRQPINSAGLDNWRPYEAWLGPLKAALGPVLERYPQAPGG